MVRTLANVDGSSQYSLPFSFKGLIYTGFPFLVVDITWLQPLRIIAPRAGHPDPLPTRVLGQRHGLRTMRKLPALAAPWSSPHVSPPPCLVHWACSPLYFQHSGCNDVNRGHYWIKLLLKYETRAFLVQC